MVRKLGGVYRHWIDITLVLIAAMFTPRSNARPSATVDDLGIFKVAKLAYGAKALGFGPAVLLISVCLAPCIGRAETPQLIGPNGTQVDKLRTAIDRKTDVAAKTLSPAGRQAMQASLSRFYQWVDAYCDKPGSLEDSSGGNLRCIYGEYFNYIDHVPKSVYSVGPWTVYETAAYGLLWGGTDPLDQDFHRPPGELQISVPHVDAGPTPLSIKLSWALREQVHSLISRWAVEGWQLTLSIHIETINTCYASFAVEQFVYTGGAHPNGYFESFNWNRTSDAPLNLADLFKPGIDWRRNIVTLYEKHVRSGDGGVRPSILEDQPFLTEESLQRSIDKNIVVTDHGLKIVVGGLAPAFGLILPAVELKWAELQPWLVPSAPCTSADAKLPSPEAAAGRVEPLADATAVLSADDSPPAAASNQRLLSGSPHLTC